MVVIAERDAALLEKSTTIVEKMAAWAERDVALADQDSALLKRDAAISTLAKVEGILIMCPKTPQFWRRHTWVKAPTMSWVY